MDETTDSLATWKLCDRGSEDDFTVEQFVELWLAV